jgi:UDP-N-acetylglucosamine--N-acetylmuramyl-(pentapeptide) pyrophosphoryl-undecaprenol N-acetylglucosamine transferase
MNILIGAGGTGGHIYPGLAIAHLIKEKHPDADIRFVGTSRGMENAIVPHAGYPLETIRVRGFERKLSWGTLKSVKELLHGMGDAKRLLKECSPDLVIGMGGYVCGPLLLLASRMGIPTVLHEQNAFPGATNRLLAAYVDKIGISFPEAETWFRHEEKIFFCGNPVRKEFFQKNRDGFRALYGYEKDDFIVVSVGGSLGAETINQGILHWLAHPPVQSKVRLIHITGKNRYDDFCAQMESLGVDPGFQHWYKILPYSDAMHEVMGMADVMVSRAGAMSVAEIAASGIPSILVPYPMATGNHQEFNARTITDKGGGLLMLDQTLKGSPELLKQQLENWVDHPDTLMVMGKITEEAAAPEADRLFYDEIVPFLKRGQDEY